MSQNNKEALPSGAQEKIGPKWRSRAPDGSAPLFFRPVRSEVMPILRFFRPGPVNPTSWTDPYHRGLSTKSGPYGYRP